jgi:hypothetical protein
MADEPTAIVIPLHQVQRGRKDKTGAARAKAYRQRKRQKAELATSPEAEAPSPESLIPPAFPSPDGAIAEPALLLMKNLTCFILPIWGEWGEIFSIMAQIGFFRRTGDRYQMTIPERLSGSGIEAALEPSGDGRRELSPSRALRELPQQVGCSEVDAEVGTVALDATSGRSGYAVGA